MAYIFQYKGTGTFQGYEYMPVDGDFKKLELVDPTPDEDVMFEAVLFGLKGKPVTAKNMPTRLFRDGPKKFLYDIEYTLAGAMLLNDRARDLIDSFEPGIHQYWPMEILDKNDEVIGHRHMLIVCNRVDSIDNSQTWPPIEGKRLYDPVVGDQRNRLTLNSNKIAGMHLWAEKRWEQSLFISDRLWSAIDTQGLTGIIGKFHKEEISE